MAQQLSNKEIAARLVITPATVGQHNYNIFQKPGVKTHWQAATEATALGILPSHWNQLGMAVLSTLQKSLAEVAKPLPGSSFREVCRLIAFR